MQIMFCRDQTVFPGDMIDVAISGEKTQVLEVFFDPTNTYVANVRCFVRGWEKILPIGSIRWVLSSKENFSRDALLTFGVPLVSELVCYQGQIGSLAMSVIANLAIDVPYKYIVRFDEQLYELYVRDGMPGIVCRATSGILMVVGDEFSRWVKDHLDEILAED